MQSLKYFLPAALAAAIAVPMQTSAQGFYVEGAVGVMEDDDFLLAPGTRNTNLLGARAGWEITPYIAVEGEYFAGLNEYETHFTTSALPSTDRFLVTLEESVASTYGIYGKLTVPVGDSLKLFSRVGIATVEKEIYFEAEDAQYSSARNSFDDDYIAAGLGMSYDFNDRLYTRLDVTTYSPDAYEANSVTLGAGVRF